LPVSGIDDVHLAMSTQVECVDHHHGHHPREESLGGVTMEVRMNTHRNAGRAIRSLWILIGIMIISLGVLSTAVASPPSPLVGIGFAASALVFTIALVLAGRVTIALERARRAARPPLEIADSFPILSRVFRRKPYLVHQPQPPEATVPTSRTGQKRN
jgi:hypothetical protein